MKNRKSRQLYRRAIAKARFLPDYQSACRKTIADWNRAKQSEEGSELSVLGLRVQLQHLRHQFTKRVREAS